MCCFLVLALLVVWITSAVSSLWTNLYEDWTKKYLSVFADNAALITRTVTVFHFSGYFCCDRNVLCRVDRASYLEKDEAMVEYARAAKINGSKILAFSLARIDQIHRSSCDDEQNKSRTSKQSTLSGA